jgi:hypothetical protein
MSTGNRTLSGRGGSAPTGSAFVICTQKVGAGFKESRPNLLCHPKLQSATVTALISV